MATNRELMSRAHWNDVYLNAALDEITEVEAEYIVMQGEVVGRGEEEHVFILEDGYEIFCGAVGEAISDLTPDRPAPILSTAENVAYSLREALIDDPEFAAPVTTVKAALDFIAELVVNGDGVVGGEPGGGGSPPETLLRSGGVSVITSSNVRVPARGSRPGTHDPMGQSAGWYFRNNLESDYVSWYMVGNVHNNEMPLGELAGCYAVVEVRGSVLPHFVVSTSPEQDSKVLYGFEGDVSEFKGETVVLFWGQDPGFFPGYRRVECQLLTSDGDLGDDETVYLVSVDSPLADPFECEFVVTQYGYTHGGAVDTYLLSSPVGFQAVEAESE